MKMKKLLFVVLLLSALLGCSGGPGESSPDADYIRCMDESVMPIMEKVELDMDMINEVLKERDIPGGIAMYGVWVDDSAEMKIAILACPEPSDPLLYKAREDLLAGLGEYLIAGELAAQGYRYMNMISVNMSADYWNEGTRLIKSAIGVLEDYEVKY